MPNSVLEFVKRQIVDARQYTEWLLEQVDPQAWFVRPPGVPTHVAWQVGHLAMAQFRLCIFFVRPVEPQDRAVISDQFMAYFRKGTTPVDDPRAYPPLEEIRSTFDKVHNHVLMSWNRYAEIDLHESALCGTHRIVRSKLDSLAWAARHEMVHTGQIALLRRMLGYDPLW